ncbi:MAG: hypothetical protein P8174_07585, partial [Gemmatimonadota bacterium]
MRMARPPLAAARATTVAVVARVVLLVFAVPAAPARGQAASLNSAEQRCMAADTAKGWRVVAAQ